MTKHKDRNRLPAEWELQDAVLLAWPHQNTDWAPMLEEVEAVYLEMTRKITGFEPVIIVAPEADRLQERLLREHIDLTRVTLLNIDTNDTWIRDFGPFIIHQKSHIQLLNFTFNAWGSKFSAEKDNLVTEKLHTSGVFGKLPRLDIDLVLEGGSIEVDGRGTLLTTSQCLLNQNRNPLLNRNQLEEQLSVYFGIDHFLWLDHGSLSGDDTDAHIDTLARLCPNDTIVFVSCPDQDDVHFQDFKMMENQLRSFATRKGQPFRLLPLPWPRACLEGGQRLPATYANFLIINKAVLVPTYRDPSDAIALRTISEAFPQREVIGIDCRPLIKQHGSLHCATMQLPRGVLT